MLEYDADDLSYSDVLVIFLMDKRPIMKTRLQKMSLLYNELYNDDKGSANHNAYFFGGYSDDIDESAENLVDIGIVNEDREGYTLTDYGIKLKDYIINDISNQSIEVNRIDNIKKSLSTVSDKRLVGLTYSFYEDTAVNSTIKSSVEKMNGNLKLNDKLLSDVKKEEFENYLRNGTSIVLTS